MKQGYVYVMGNNRPTLYIGVTSNLKKRIYEHKYLNGSVFTSKYKLNKLLYYEVAETIESAIIREKQMKNMNRDEKIEMIRKFNPGFIDLWNGIQ